MQLSTIINEILKEQKDSFTPFYADIVLLNGNIQIRALHIVEFDPHTKILKGITSAEEYRYPREEREPEYCYLKLSEIKELNCPYLDLRYYSKKNLQYS